MPQIAEDCTLRKRKENTQGKYCKIKTKMVYCACAGISGGEERIQSKQAAGSNIVSNIASNRWIQDDQSAGNR